MQSNFINLISTAIKKSIKRKHTLPNYNLRFKPFFSRPGNNVDINFPIKQDGSLKIVLRTLSRLNYPRHVTHVYGRITLSPYEFVTISQLDEEVKKFSLPKIPHEEIFLILERCDINGY